MPHQDPEFIEGIGARGRADGSNPQGYRARATASATVGEGERGRKLDAWSYINAIRRFKWFIVAAGAAGAAASFLLVLLVPPTYTARTTLEVFGRNENFMNFSQVDPQAGTGLYSATSSNLLTQIQLLRSASIRTRVIERLRMEGLPKEPHGIGVVASMRRAIGIVPDDAAQRSRAALEMAVKTFRPAVVRETRIIEIQCRSTNPAVASMYLNALVEEYMDQTLASRSIASGKTSKWLTDQLAEVKASLELSEKRLADFSRATGYTAATPQETLSGTRLRQLREELSAVQAERIAKQAEYERLLSVPAESLAGVVSDSRMASSQTTLLELRRQLAELLTTMTRAHPQVRRLTAQIEEVESALAENRRSILERAKSDFETAKNRERMLANAHAGQTHAFTGQSQQSGQRTQLEREVSVALQTYNGLLSQVNQAGMAAATPSEYVRQIDPATDDILPEGLKPLPTTILGFFSGLLLGAALVAGLEAMVQALRSSRYSTGVTQAPELAVIPSIQLAGLEESRFLPASRNSLPAALGSSNQAATRSAAIAWGDSPSLYVDSFRRAVGSLLMNAWSEQRRCVLVVSSPGQGEGKTTVTANLGIALVEAGRKVLLVDMDFRRPQLHTRFQVKASMSIAEVILSKPGVDGALPENLIQQTGLPGLSVMPAVEEDPARLSATLFHPNLPRLITRLQTEYDFVLFDTPPAEFFPEARALGAMTDGVILVLRAGKTSKAKAAELRRQLAEDATPLVGTILNDAMPEPPAKSYYGYYRRDQAN